MKKLLIIGYVWPEPNSSAAGSRMLDLIHLFIADQWQITFASASALSPHRVDLQQFDVQEQVIELNSSSFDSFIKELKPDAVLFDRFFTVEQFGWRVEHHCPNALRLLDTEDLHSLRNTRHRLLKEYMQVSGDGALPSQLLDKQLLAHEMLKDRECLRELAAIYRCDFTMMISVFEMELLTDCFKVPENLLCYLPYQRLTTFSGIKSPNFTERAHFLFVGNFRHAPNWDAVLWLKQTLWPGIHEKLPTAELHVYGAYPPPKATDLHKPTEGFYIKGWVDNMKKPSEMARVILAPLRFGAGLKGKLFEAMQYATPSVTTSIGAEGIANKKDWPGKVSDLPDEFVEAAVDLYQNENSWLTEQQKIFSVLDSFQDDYGPSFIDQLSALLKNCEQHRSQNILGKILCHESFQSHKYMSLWIEEKNKKDFPRFC